MEFETDRSTIDALSWRLGSELLRRHPHELWLNRGHPGGGLYDCLIIASGPQPPTIMLNREGTIQVHGRVGGAGHGGGDSDWRPTTWEQYLTAEPKAFLLALEAAAGLPAPPSLPSSTRPILLYRLFATLAALTSKTTEPYTFEQGYIDSAGWGGGPNDKLEEFPAAARDLAAARGSNPQMEPGFEYWMVFQNGQPRWAFERNNGKVWTARGDHPQDMMKLYISSGRNIEQTALRLLRSPPADSRHAVRAG